LRVSLDTLDLQCLHLVLLLYPDSDSGLTTFDNPTCECRRRRSLGLSLLVLESDKFLLLCLLSSRFLSRDDLSLLSAGLLLGSLSGDFSEEQVTTGASRRLTLLLTYGLGLT